MQHRTITFFDAETDSEDSDGQRVDTYLLRDSQDEENENRTIRQDRDAMAEVFVSKVHFQNTLWA